MDVAMYLAARNCFQLLKVSVAFHIDTAGRMGKVSVKKCSPFDISN